MTDIKLNKPAVINLNKILDDRGNLQKCYQDYRSYDLPVTLRMSEECLSLPISPVMTKMEIEKVIEVINKW